ncbi:MAG: chemotaxis protein CheX [Petroclostridium sp.]|jgi:chemotaxis protein CheX|uniref:chemotaxis protein CheX n=1 Tax=Petroclostridium xylanilyticum TaxID=1792311 RepID=UPI000B98AB04|nr:chemotaxis protein CheX [Petroclostridium xylanilyticum]MBZ4646581.1 putative inhibitor of methylation, CheC [Clostridia bacterium]MDK2810028.1 chemotaxis protein CheX [Petroclostridium sp.]
MNVEYINPFIEASQSVLKSIANMEVTLGKVYLKNSPYPSDTLAIIIGLTGKLRGQVIFSMNKEVACKIASAMMMGMPVTELDEISRSAVTEAANMILGNTATILYNRGIAIDITPPSLLMGDNMQISTNKMKTVCVPLNISNGGTIELDIAVAE